MQSEESTPRLRVRKGGRRNGAVRLTREDLLRIAISVVRARSPSLDPAQFMTEVSLAFEALSQEMDNAGLRQKAS
jgi:hypothetical protein